jgi:hypothetical protein
MEPTPEKNETQSPPDPMFAIYTALIGREPQFDPTAGSKEAGVELKFKVEANLKLGGTLSPFHDASVTDRIGQWCANGIKRTRKLWQRIKGDRPTDPPLPATKVEGKPVIILGPAVRKRKQNQAA